MCIDPLTPEELWPAIPDLSPPLQTPSLEQLQPRLYSALGSFFSSTARLLILHGHCEGVEWARLAREVKPFLPEGCVHTAYRPRYEEGRLQWMATERTAASVVIAPWVEFETLFGSVTLAQGVPTLVPGLLQQAQGGVLLLGAEALPRLWLRLKSALNTQQLHWALPGRPLPCPIEPLPLDLRVIIVADADAVSQLSQSDPHWAVLALQADLQSQFFLKNEEAYRVWTAYARDCFRQLDPTLQWEASGWEALIRAGQRACEDQHHLPLEMSWFAQLLWALKRPASAVTAERLEAALEAQRFQVNLAYLESHQAIHRGWVNIQTEGDAIGQVNALSVVEMESGACFGMPVRISCVLLPGEGEVVDVDRRVELGGSIHTKGMLILEAYLASLLGLDQSLPFSLSVVSEQAYEPFDGDSASLATLCAMISAIAKVPLKQAIALTGSVDQYGNIQAVGGINDKVEGFFTLCSTRPCDACCGVLLPESAVDQLVPSGALQEALVAGRFSIWPVQRVEEALTLLTDLSLEALCAMMKKNSAQWRQAEGGGLRRWCFWR